MITWSAGTPYEGNRIDHDDLPGAGERRALDRIRSDPGAAVHDQTLPGSHARGLHRRAPAGGNSAAQQRGDVEGDVVGQLDTRVLGDHGPFLGDSTGWFS
jgi:hypothetical protein